MLTLKCFCCTWTHLHKPVHSMTQANSCAAVKITDLCVCFAAQAATTQQLLFLQGNKMPFFSLQDAATNFHFFYQTVSHEDRHHTIVVSVVGPILFLREFGKKKSNLCQYMYFSRPAENGSRPMTSRWPFKVYWVIAL